MVAKWYGMALGIGVVVVLALGIQTLFRLLTGSAGGGLSTQGVTSLPLQAELAKAGGVFLFFWLLRDECNHVRDGLLYGALIGLGFLAAETLLLCAYVYVKTGLLATRNVVAWRFVFLGLNNDTIWAAIFGVGVGLAAQTERRAARVAAPLAAFAVALLGNVLGTTNQVRLFLDILDRFGLHAGSLAQFAQLPTLQVWLAAAASNLAVQWPIYAVVVVALLAANRWERAMVPAYLADEIGTRTITAEEHAAIRAGHPLPHKRRARKLMICQYKLAYRKWQVTRRGGQVADDPVAALWRSDIASLRAGRRALMLAALSGERRRLLGGWRRRLPGAGLARAVRGGPATAGRVAGRCQARLDRARQRAAGWRRLPAPIPRQCLVPLLGGIGLIAVAGFVLRRRAVRATAGGARRMRGP
jgi:hypothetical protein